MRYWKYQKYFYQLRKKWTFASPATLCVFPVRQMRVGWSYTVGWRYTYNSYHHVCAIKTKLFPVFQDDDVGYELQPAPQFQNIVVQHMDIAEPLSQLRKLLESKLQCSLKDHEFFLQDQIPVGSIFFLFRWIVFQISVSKITRYNMYDRETFRMDFQTRLLVKLENKGTGNFG